LKIETYIIMLLMNCLSPEVTKQNATSQISHDISFFFLNMFYISCFFDVQSSPHFSPPFSVYHDSGSQISSSMAAPLLASTSPGRGGFIPSKATRRYLSGGIGKHGRILKKNMGPIRIRKKTQGDMMQVSTDKSQGKRVS